MNNSFFYPILGSFLADLMNSLYLHYYFIPLRVTEAKIAWLLSMQGFGDRASDPFFLHEYTGVFQNTLSFVFMLFCVFNMISYLFLAKNKKWAVNYVKSIALLGAIMSLVDITNVMATPWYWNVANLITLALYVWVYMNLKARKAAPQSADPLLPSKEEP